MLAVFPLVKLPVGVGASLIVVVLIARRWFLPAEQGIPAAMR
jgi:hypothetical protein